MARSNYADMIRENLQEGDRIDMKIDGKGWDYFTIESIDEDTFTVFERCDPIDYDDVLEIDC